MTTSVQQDALLGKFAVLAYSDRATVNTRLASDPNFANWELSTFLIEGSFAAFAFRNSATGQYVISYRGTDGLGDGSPDVALARGQWHGQFDLAMRFANDVRSGLPPGAPGILVTGHSLGGAMAQIVSFAFGFDGTTLDPGGAARVVTTSEFQTSAGSYALPANGLGMPASFRNYAIVNSVVSGGTGAHLGALQYLPGLQFSSSQALNAGLLFLLVPALAVAYGIGIDQFGNIHSSVNASQALDLFAAAGLQPPSGQFNLVPAVRSEYDSSTSTYRDVPIGGQLLLKDASGNVMMNLSFSGQGNGRTLTMTDPGGTVRTITAQDLTRSLSSNAPFGTLPIPDRFYADAVYFNLAAIAGRTGASVDDLVAANPGLAANASIAPGTPVVLPPSASKINIFINPNLSARLDNPDDPISTPNADGTALGSSTGAYQVSVNASVLNTNTDLASAIIGDSATGGVRPGNASLSGTDGQLTTIANWGDAFDQASAAGTANLLAATTQNAGTNVAWIPADPLVLDLNGDGVKLTSYTDKTVLFDVDNDGGSKEQTGWVAANTITSSPPAINTDGIVVYDPNNTGVISNISQTFSEYFGGSAGSGGNAGTKLFANGFAALKSLDLTAAGGNNDNTFTSADNAWGSVKVWVDDNADGISFKDTNGNGARDSGEASELKTLADLGITSINLVSTSQSGLINGGNEVLATGNFVIGGAIREAQAANFLANPNGHSFIDKANGSNTGTKITTEGSSSVLSYVSHATPGANNIGESMNTATLGVANLYGSAGNDTLTGDTGANWLAGGAGSDNFNAGAGDDVLLIDASDLQANIHAGTGNDIAQVVGDAGVTLNLTQAEVEIVQGGRGNDVLIGGGRSSVFVRGGEGDDILIGGAANDVLSGEDGDDLIDGGAGNDLIRGHRGRDVLLGGAGDDIIDGGLDDDHLSGGDGNDVIKGSQGDDVIDGGAGTDIAEFSGSFADYRLTQLVAGTGGQGGIWRIVDTRANRTGGNDGADTLTSIEKLDFADMSAVDITLDNPLPVKDVVQIDNRSGTKLILVINTAKTAGLLANDRDWQGEDLTITSVSDLVGGWIVGTNANGATSTTNRGGVITPTLTANKELQFNPDADFTGVMSFKYKIEDVDHTPGATAIQIGTNTQAEMRGQVLIKTPDMPTDSLFADQWYLSDAKVIPVWKDYTGKGVRIGQFEPAGPYAVSKEILDYRQSDLQPNIDPRFLRDPSNPLGENFSSHATMVAGVMVAARNGDGAVGVAYDAKIAGYWIGKLNPQDSLDFSALAKLPGYDIVNNSWAMTPAYLQASFESYLGNAARLGRGGLGTAIVSAGGNDRAIGGNSNNDRFSNSHYAIQVGAVNAAADISTLTVGQAPFSNPGASLLVSAAGSNVATTARTLTTDQGTVFGSDTAAVQGTSFATPVVSGVVALMLEANPNLGFRDIQEILALSARKVADASTVWQNNNASGWNGGAMHVSHDYGFGAVDALAAVRLAETWTKTSTIGNEITMSGASAANLNAAIPDGTSTWLEGTVTMAAGMRVEHAEVTVNLNHLQAGDLVVKLIGPGTSGTESILLNHPGVSAASVRGDQQFAGSSNLNFTFSTVRDWGESSEGDWQVQIVDSVSTDTATGDTGTLNSFSLKLFGSATTIDDTYTYTNEYAASVANASARGQLNDTNDGRDAINAAAVSGNSSIDLTGASGSSIGSTALSITTPGNIENVFTGDGNDTIVGNSAANLLDSGRGMDTMTGGAGADVFVVRKQASVAKTITDFAGAAGDRIYLAGFGALQYSGLAPTASSGDVLLTLGDGETLLLKSTTVSALAASQFVFADRFEPMRGYVDSSVAVGMPASGAISGTAGVDTISGSAVADSITGLAGDDSIHGGGGADTLDGGTGSDRLFGDAGDDVIYLDGDSTGFSLSSEGLVYSGGYVAGGIGADRFVVRAAGAGNFSNIIVDFDSANTNEKIDVSAMDVQGFANLGFSANNMNDASMVSVSYNGQYLATLMGYTAAQLNASNFIFAGGAQSASASDSWVTTSGSTLTGAAGGNLVDGGTGSQAMVGRTGDDIYIVDNVGDTITETPGGGFDTVRASVTHTLAAEVENLVLTGTSAINGTGNTLANRVTGNSAANLLDGGGGVDALLGGAGNDAYVVDNQGDSITENLNEGTDLAQSSVSFTIGENIENLTLTGTSNINATGNSLANTLTGNAGDNVIDGGPGADTMAGGAGDDTYYIDSASDTTTEVANQGIDTVYSSVDRTLGDNLENLVLYGAAIVGTGNVLDNEIVGNARNNALYGGAGNDFLDGVGDFLDPVQFGGGDTLSGGAGDDTFVVDSTRDTVIENSGEGNDTVQSLITFTLSNQNIENVVLTGTANINATGNLADNRLIGNAGNNVLSGDAGNDLLDGGAAADTMSGGTGNDTYVVDDVNDTVNESAAGGSDTVQSLITFDLTSRPDIENLTLTGFAAINGTGNSLANTLTGNSGANLLSGADNDDTLSGGEGNDTLGGGNGTDTALYTGNRAAYTIVRNTAQGRFDLSGAEGAAQLTGVEVLQFADSTTILASLSNSNGVVDNFVAFKYLASNPGLIGVYGADAKAATSHFVQWGYVEGRLIASFDAFKYLASNPALIGVYGANAAAAIDHYVRWGFTENRPTTSFDAFKYLASNPGLIGVYGADAVAAVNHYVQWGYTEGRLTTGFDAFRYLASNPGLIGVYGPDAPGAIDHYVRWGYAEGRPTEAFDAHEYVASNPGLIGVYGIDIIGATDHYVRWGFTEGRPTTTFDAAQYRANYVDLSALNLDGARLDFINGGYLNGRTDHALVIAGAGNNDSLAGGEGNESITGAGGDDTLNGGAGNDTLTGGTGADRLVGGTGNDTYWLARGDGADAVVENDATAGNTDVARFAADVSANQIWFRKVNNDQDLEVSIVGTTDKFTLQNWYGGPAYHVEEFKTGADNKTLLDSQVQNLVSVMAGISPPPLGTASITQASYSSVYGVITGADSWH